MAVVFPVGTRGKSGQDAGNSWILSPSMPSLNSKKMDDEPVGIEEAGGIRASGDEISAYEGFRAYERKAQSLSKPGPLIAKVGCNIKGPLGLGLSLGGKKPDETEVTLRREEDSSAKEKGKATSLLPVVQSSSSAKKEVKFGSKKLWTTLFPPSSDCRQGLRYRSEPLLHGKNPANSKEFPKEEAFEAGSQAKRGSSASPLISRRSPRFRKRCLGEGASSSRDEVALSKLFFEEDREGFLGRVGSDLCGSAIAVLPSTPEIRGKGLSFMENCGLLVAENLEVISSSPIQSPSSSPSLSCGLASSFLSPYVPNLPNSAFHTKFPMENRVISEFFPKKDDVGTVGQISVGIHNLVVEEIQPAYPNQLTESANPILINPFCLIRYPT